MATEHRSASCRGRFAPSPTGPLHFGSLVAALGSYLEVRSRGGEWLVRMENLDRPREVAGAADGILRTLEAFGFEWDGGVLYQSRRDEAYRAAAGELATLGLLYPCRCSRKTIAAVGRPGSDGWIYPGTCRNRPLPCRGAHSWRVHTTADRIHFVDTIQGPQSQHLERELGDFVVRRADGLFAYQLAVVVDDAWQGVNQVVRGCDLLTSTPRQIYLQRLLGFDSPDYAHLPLVVDRHGRKLSKQDAAAPVDPTDPLPSLCRAMAHLGQRSPPEPPVTLAEFWIWAQDIWETRDIPRVQSRPGYGVPIG